MESSSLDNIKKETNYNINQENFKNFYYPPIIHESYNNYLMRKLRKEYIYCIVKIKIFSLKFIFDSSDIL